MAKLTVDQLQHIRLIICRNEKQRAIELIMLNGYAGNLVAAEKIWMVENGGKK